jgi:hypothetical protein
MVRQFSFRGKAVDIYVKLLKTLCKEEFLSVKKKPGHRVPGFKNWILRSILLIVGFGKFISLAL